MKVRHSRPVAFIVFGLIVLIGIVLDRLTKVLAELHLADGHAQAFIPGFIDFRLLYNSGAAWGLLDGARWFFVVIMLVAVVAMIIYLLHFKRHAALQVIGLGLVAAGALGNGIDRALTGEVIDFIHTLFIEFPSFNVADSCISVGAILFVLAMVFGEHGFATSAAPAKSDAPATSDAPAKSAAPATSDEAGTIDVPDAGDTTDAAMDAPQAAAKGAVVLDPAPQTSSAAEDKPDAGI